MTRLFIHQYIHHQCTTDDDDVQVTDDDDVQVRAPRVACPCLFPLRLPTIGPTSCSGYYAYRGWLVSMQQIVKSAVKRDAASSTPPIGIGIPMMPDICAALLSITAPPAFFAFNTLARYPRLLPSNLHSLPRRCRAQTRTTMDAYSISYTSPSHRSSSRIYQDLKSARPYSTVNSRNCDQLPCTLAAKDASSQCSKREPITKPHVAVIGAGLSGLRCADILLQHGFKVTVMEARNRVGGRLHQELLPNGHLVDVGPNWIHGTLDNPMHELAKQTKTAASRWDTASHIFDESGSLLPLTQGEQFSDAIWGIIQDAFEHSNRSTTDIDSAKSLADFFLDKVAEKIPETEPDFKHKRRIVLQMSEMWGAFIGSPISRQSLKFFWLEECIEGENLFCAGTYKKILDVVARPVLAGADILFNTQARRIFSRRGPKDEKVQVEVAADGFGRPPLLFDEVVVTCPLGWLKRNPDAFEPPLPTRLTRAIDSIGYGCLEKVYISFPKAFWLCQEGDDGKFKGFVQWLSPDYAPRSNPDRWNQEAVELASLAPDTAHPTLLFYMFGEQSKHLTTAVAKLKDQADKDAFLVDFFKPYYSRLPHYSETSEECRPTGCLATDWVHDELAGCGSYTNFQVGLEEGDMDVETMREGLPDRGLWFAGEHTAPFVALGTATGAYWSGESVGRRIAEAYGRLPGQKKAE